MRLVLHFGMPKTGSTALQEGLVAARAPLAASGILYPGAPVIGHSANFLMWGIAPPQARPRYLRHQLKGRDAPPLFEAWLEQIRTRCAAGDIHTLVLSAENLWQIASPGPAQALRRLLESLGASRIEAVAYVRRPSDWYLSAAQQVLRASHKVRIVGPIPYRAPIETMETHVADPGMVRIFPFDRAAFPGGDILGHFREAMLPGAPLGPAEAGRQVNATLSAEGMSILREYRAETHPAGNGRFTRDTARLRAALARAETDIGGQVRPRLRPEIAARLDWCSPDLAWLRDRWGIAFPGLEDAGEPEGRDPAGLEKGHRAEEPGTGEAGMGEGGMGEGGANPAGWTIRPTSIEEICLVDPARRRALLNRTLRRMAGRDPKKSGKKTQTGTVEDGV